MSTTRSARWGRADALSRVCELECQRFSLSGDALSGESATMTPPFFIRAACAGLALLTMDANGACAVESARGASDGKAVLEANCSRCHSIEATGASPLEKAPPLREVYVKYP